MCAIPLDGHTELHGSHRLGVFPLRRIVHLLWLAAYESHRTGRRNPAAYQPGERFLKCTAINTGKDIGRKKTCGRNCTYRRCGRGGHYRVGMKFSARRRSARKKLAAGRNSVSAASAERRSGGYVYGLRKRHLCASFMTSNYHFSIIYKTANRGRAFFWMR